jgi:hypothetical protein
VFLIGLLAFALALAARLGWQHEMVAADWPDTAEYLASAASLFEHGRMSSERYMPLYPILLHFTGPALVLTVQAVLSALTAAMVAMLAARLFGCWQAGAVAALLAAVDPLLIFYANMRLTETLYTFLLVAALAGLYLRWYWLGALLLVLGILTRPVLDLAAPVLVLGFLIANRESLSLGLIGRRLGVYFAVYVVLMAPWWAHNHRAYGSFVRLNLGDGIVMQLENNEVFDKVGLDFSALSAAYDRFGDLKDPVAINEARKAAAIDYIKAQPLHYLERCLERLARFWTPVPGSPSPLVNLVAFLAALPVLVGAAGCLLAGGAPWRALLPVLMVILWFSAVHGATHALPRYRLPLEPLLIVLAAGWFAKGARRPATALPGAADESLAEPGEPEGGVA